MNGGDNYDRPKVLVFKRLEAKRIRAVVTDLARPSGKEVLPELSKSSSIWLYAEKPENILLPQCNNAELRTISREDLSNQEPPTTKRQTRVNEKIESMLYSDIKVS